MTANDLIRALHGSFQYTVDNNRDLISDELFSMYDVVEEVIIQMSYQILVAYIVRNERMIDENLKRYPV